MQWEDVTKKSQMEIELAVYEFVSGNPQPVVDLFQAVLEESFNEGYECMMEKRQEIDEREGVKTYE